MNTTIQQLKPAKNMAIEVFTFDTLAAQGLLANEPDR